jgi:hypothetical protein
MQSLRQNAPIRVAHGTSLLVHIPHWPSLAIPPALEAGHGGTELDTTSLALWRAIAQSAGSSRGVC